MQWPVSTQARYLDAVRLHGRDPKLIAKAMGNRTIGACKKFWSKVGHTTFLMSGVQIRITGLLTPVLCTLAAVQCCSAHLLCTSGSNTCTQLVRSTHVLVARRIGSGCTWTRCWSSTSSGATPRRPAGWAARRRRAHRRSCRRSVRILRCC